VNIVPDLAGGMGGENAGLNEGEGIQGQKPDTKQDQDPTKASQRSRQSTCLPALIATIPSITDFDR